MIFNLCQDLIYDPHFCLQESTKAGLNEVGGIVPINTESLKEGLLGFFSQNK